MRRVVCLLIGLIGAVTVGLVVIQIRFSAGLAPAPFLAAGYLVGATMFLIVNAVTRSASMLRVIVLAALVSAFAAIFGGAGVQFFVLLPFSGAVAASMPTSWLHFGTGPDNAPPHPLDRHAVRHHHRV